MSVFLSSQIFKGSNIVYRHASIDPAIRAARGLPEDLIRLCVGIEDPTDLIEDLEVALLQAGAIKPQAAMSNRIQAGLINKAIEKLADRGAPSSPEHEATEWAVSAPGKVILFGEHAVVHGVVSYFLFQTVQQASYPLISLSIDCCRRCCRSSMLWIVFS